MISFRPYWDYEYLSVNMMIQFYYALLVKADWAYSNLIETESAVLPKDTSSNSWTLESGRLNRLKPEARAKKQDRRGRAEKDN